ncbi:MAG TPA: MFS transporter [Bacillales bacterium]|nr:MFS transporter [Bacillales bacterium]
MSQNEDLVLSRTERRRAATASLVGTAIEWYDYFLYGTAAALIFPQLFFPQSSDYIGTLEAFATFFLGFAARPVGGAIFGHFGDRIGRKATLIVTLLLMGISSALIGILPTYDSIGVWAPTILIILRILQGIGVGGEWGGSVLLSMESGRGDRRGFMTSWPQLGVAIGLLVSSALVSLFLSWTGDSFNTWGWRIPFLLSLVLVGIGLFIRLKIEETPVFKKILAKKQTDKAPVWAVIKKHPKEICLSALARMAEQAPFYIFVSFVLAYGAGTLGMDRQFLVNGTLVASILSLFCVPFFGYLSDRIGRKKMYLIGAACTLIWAFPYYGILNTAIPALVFLAIVISLIPHDMMYGPQAALIAENFPAKLRYSGSSLGYQLASVIAGGPAPMIAAFLFHSFGSAYAISIYLVFNAVVTIIAVAFMKDRTKEDINLDTDEAS